MSDGPLISPKTGEPLCPEWAKRAAMPDDEFWDYVFNRNQPEPDLSAWLPGFEWDASIDTISVANPCPVCGSHIECGTDNEGRPWVHCVEADR